MIKASPDVLTHPFVFFLSSAKAVMVVTIVVGALLSLIIPSGLASLIAAIVSGILIARVQGRLLREQDVHPAWIRYLLASLTLSIGMAVCVQVASLLTLLLFGWFWDALGTVLFWLLQYRLFKRFILRP